MLHSPRQGQKRSDVDADASVAAKETKWAPGPPVCQARALATVGINVGRKEEKVEGSEGEERKGQ